MSHRWCGWHGFLLRAKALSGWGCLGELSVHREFDDGTGPDVHHVVADDYRVVEVFVGHQLVLRQHECAERHLVAVLRHGDNLPAGSC